MAQKPRATSRGGRPAYKPTAADRRTVEEMKFCGESEATISRALGICEVTLRKYFPDELADGYSNRRKEVIGLLFKSARKGNVSAQKKLDEIGRAVGADEAVNRRGAHEKAAPPVGKKEQRQRDAEAVTGKFAPPQPPRLVVKNG